jgi:hypothetical protein
MQKRQMKDLEMIKMDKILGENSFIKEMIANVDKRVEDEVNKRIN